MSIEKSIACVGKECVACGNCVKNCSEGAISVYKGLYALVDEEKCIGCGECAAVCPADIIEIMEKEDIVYEEALV